MTQRLVLIQHNSGRAQCETGSQVPLPAPHLNWSLRVTSGVCLNEAVAAITSG